MSFMYILLGFYWGFWIFRFVAFHQIWKFSHCFPRYTPSVFLEHVCWIAWCCFTSGLGSSNFFPASSLCLCSDSFYDRLFKFTDFSFMVSNLLLSQSREFFHFRYCILSSRIPLDSSLYLLSLLCLCLSLNPWVCL